jgi:acetyl/propionyl-CoA carboxylase alpha subunit
VASTTPGGRKIVLRDQAGEEHVVTLNGDGSAVVGDQVIRVVALGRGEIRAGDRIAWSAGDDTVRWVFVDGHIWTFDVQPADARSRRSARHDAGLSAPMPATVIKIPVAGGDTVRAGDVLIILEAMKMELPVRAPADGIVSSIRCRVGELVQPGQDLIELTAIPT